VSLARLWALDRWLRIASLLGAFGAWLCLVVYVARYCVDVPYLDQWELVPYLESFRAGTLTIPDLFAPHNEHRIALPRIIMLLLAQSTDWDTRAELACNVLFATLLLIVAIRAARPALADARHVNAFLLCAALTVFSLSQWQNWFLGWQLQIFLALLLVFSALSLLTVQNNRLAWLAVPCALGATFSFANGILVWPLGLWLILRGHTRAPGFVVAWCLLALLSLGVVLGTPDGTTHPAAHDRNILESAWAFFGYFLRFLGQPLAPWSGPLAAVVGGLGFGLFLWMLPKCQTSARRLWLAIAAFSVATALLTAWARQGYGVEQAMSSRYITLASPLWLALVVLIGNARPYPRWCMLGAVSLLVGIGSVHGAYIWSLRYPAYEAARLALINDGPDEQLRPLYPVLETLRVRRVFLLQERMSVFRSLPPGQASAPGPVTPVTMSAAPPVYAEDFAELHAGRVAEIMRGPDIDGILPNFANAFQWRGDTFMAKATAISLLLSEKNAPATAYDGLDNPHFQPLATHHSRPLEYFERAALSQLALSPSRPLWEEAGQVLRFVAPISGSDCASCHDCGLGKRQAFLSYRFTIDADD